MKKKKLLASVLVHTRNSQRTIREHLESIKNQSYPKIEIIVVDNNSIDKTKKIAREFTDKVYNFGPERSAQRNFAAKKAKGDYYLVPDSDMILEKGVIAECVDLVTKDPKIKAVVIPEKSFGKGFWTRCKALERSCYFGDETIEAARFFEKKVFWEFGGYDEAITGPEDWDLPQRIRRKYKISRIKSFIHHDEGKLSLIKTMKKKYYYAQKFALYIEKHPKIARRQANLLFRPAFFRNWRRLLRHPILTLGMFFMRTGETTAAALGFLKTKVFSST